MTMKAVETFSKSHRIFTTMAIWGGKIISWKLHRLRLQVHSQQVFGVDPDWKALEMLLSTFLQSDQHQQNQGLRIDWDGDNWALVSRNLPITTPLNIAMLPHFPSSASTLPPSIKNAHREGWQQRKIELGVDFLLFTAPDGKYLEFSDGNILIFRNGEWLTPLDDGTILNGTTRQLLLWASKHQLFAPVLEANVFVTADDSLFFMSALRGIVSINGEVLVDVATIFEWSQLFEKTM